jgi:hypothetical protein
MERKLDGKKTDGGSGGSGSSGNNEGSSGFFNK